MKRTVYFPEIFEMVGNAQTKKEKIAVLHKYRNEKGFYDILLLCYDPRIKWMITRKEIEDLEYPRMDIADYDLAPTTLFLEARRRLYNFTTLRQPPLKKRKILQLIAGMFSVLHHKEVELFKQMVDGNIEENGMSENLIREAFPGLLSAGVESKELTVSAKSEKKTKPKEKPKRKRGRKGSKLDKHKTEIHSLLKDGNTKKSIAEKFNISIAGFNNWLKKNPIEE